jgi:hypothetical protein
MKNAFHSSHGRRDVPIGHENMVRKEGLEPSRVTSLEPKSSASTSSATFATSNTAHQTAEFRWPPLPSSKLGARIIAEQNGAAPKRFRRPGRLLSQLTARNHHTVLVDIDPVARPHAGARNLDGNVTLAFAFALAAERHCRKRNHT